MNKKHDHTALLGEVKSEMPKDELLSDLADLFKIFGDTTRIKILYALFESEMCVCAIAELLNMTQVEAGKLQMMPKITKPIELIEYAIKANQVQADKFNIQIEVDYPQEKIPKLFVDSEKIAWVLTNLLSNAIRYSKENGRVVIGVRHKKEYIELYVQDFGKGIDPRYHQSIFDRYFRVPGTKVQGSGLGLSISKDFVEAHGGTLTVQSELGKGSCFVIRLKA